MKSNIFTNLKGKPHINDTHVAQDLKTKRNEKVIKDALHQNSYCGVPRACIGNDHSYCYCHCYYQEKQKGDHNFFFWECS